MENVEYILNEFDLSFNEIIATVRPPIAIKVKGLYIKINFCSQPLIRLSPKVNLLVVTSSTLNLA